MPHSAASDLGLYCLRMPHKRDARLIWVKISSMVVYLSFVSESKSNNFDMTSYVEVAT